MSKIKCFFLGHEYYNHTVAEFHKNLAAGIITAPRFVCEFRCKKCGKACMVDLLTDKYFTRTNKVTS